MEDELCSQIALVTRILVESPASALRPAPPAVAKAGVSARRAEDRAVNFLVGRRREQCEADFLEVPVQSQHVLYRLLAHELQAHTVDET